ncbi:MAG: NAD-dependent epimerase/dehydratase family protein [Pirellulaceae bacterium]
MKTGQSVRIALMGAGAIAEIFHLPALAKNPLTRDGIVLVDPNENRLQEMATKFAVARTTTDYTSLEGEVDGVIIATPPGLHHPIAKWFLERGVHVLSEKPLTERFDQARELVEIAKRKDVGLAVNQTRRFYPTNAKIRELIAAGDLGDLRSIQYHEGFEFDWPAASPHHFVPGAKGVWSDTGIHLLDSICYWLNAKPELVAAWNDSSGGPEALMTVRLKHENCDIEIKVSRLGKFFNGFRIEGSKGSIEASIDEVGKVVVESSSGTKKTYRCGPSDVPYTDNANRMLDNFVEVIRHGAEPHVSGESTLGAIEILEQAYPIVQNYPMSWNEPWKGADSVRVKRTFDDTASRSSDVIKRVLVTGASGFLGGRIVETMLIDDEGFTPVAAIRKWTRAARVARHRVEIAICDIESPSQVEAAVEGVDAIIHCAKTDNRDSIVGGTRNLLDAAKKYGVKRFVHLSTAEVYGSHTSGTIDEQAPTPITGRLYGDSKVEAEQVCRQFRDQGVPVTILRPSIIYGPFSGWWSIAMADRLQSGNWGMFEEHGDGIANLIYVDDLVRAIRLALVHPTAEGETYNISGPDRVTWNEYFSRFNDALGLPELQSFSASQSQLRTILMDKISFVADKVMDRFEDRIMQIYLRRGLASRMMKWLKGELNSTPSSDELNDLFARDAIYTDAKIRQQLGFESAFDLNSGLKHTVDWMRLHELVTTPSPKRPSDEEVDSRSIETRREVVGA